MRAADFPDESIRGSGSSCDDSWNSFDAVALEETGNARRAGDESPGLPAIQRLGEVVEKTVEGGEETDTVNGLTLPPAPLRETSPQRTPDEEIPDGTRQRTTAGTTPSVKAAAEPTLNQGAGREGKTQQASIHDAKQDAARAGPTWQETPPDDAKNGEGERTGTPAGAQQTESDSACRSGENGTLYTVCLQADGSREKARERLEKLREEGFEDVAVIPRGSLASAMSFGVYRNTENAMRRSAHVQAKGHDVRTRTHCECAAIDPTHP